MVVIAAVGACIGLQLGFNNISNLTISWGYYEHSTPTQNFNFPITANTWLAIVATDVGTARYSYGTEIIDGSTFVSYSVAGGFYMLAIGC